MTRIAATDAPLARPNSPLSRRQKAAIVVRFLMNEGAELPLSTLPDQLQGALTQQLGQMRHVDRQTLAEVVCEFANELEGIGLSFPRGLIGALTELDGTISPQTAARLRREAGVRQLGDPWDRIRALDEDDLIGIIEREALPVAAVMLSKIRTAKAAAILGRLNGELARRLTYALGQTDSITPSAVDRIGLSLATQIDDRPERAFAEGSDARVGAILNMSPTDTRDALLDGLEEQDATFAHQVRKTIFTFAHIPDRLLPGDVVKVQREVEQPVLLTALTHALVSEDASQHAAEFLLANMSKRMADTLRSEIEEAERPTQTVGEEAMTSLIATIRRLESTGEITLQSQPDI